MLLTRDLERSKYWSILVYIPLLIYNLWEAVPLTIYGKLNIVYLGKNVCTRGCTCVLCLATVEIALLVLLNEIR